MDGSVSPNLAADAGQAGRRGGDFGYVIHFSIVRFFIGILGRCMAPGKRNNGTAETAISGHARFEMGQAISDVNSCFVSPEALPDGTYGLVQIFFLFSVYGYILFWAAEEIAEGSELLLLLPKATHGPAAGQP